MRRPLFVAIATSTLAFGLLGGCRKPPDVDSESDEKTSESKAEQKQKKAESQEPAFDGPPGLVTVSTDKAVDEVVEGLRGEIDSNDSLKMAASLDHAKNAEFVDMSLPATELLVFADPSHETPVIDKSRLAALDLPLKLLVWKKGAETRVSFTAPAYVAKRHAVERAGLFLGPMKDQLVEMVESTTGTKVKRVHEREDVRVDPLEGVIKRESQNGVDDTFEKLQSLIEEHEKLSVVGTVDFAANADSVDRSLRPTKLILFGNPEAGTPLMKASRTIGIDLPQKLLVYEGKEGGIFVVYNNPYYLAERHGLEGEDEKLKAVKSMLEKLVAKGTEEITP